MQLSQRERDGLQRWLLAFGCVTFDLDRGPELEFLAPALDLNAQERDNIAFSSFPDTAIFDSGQAVFSFRMRSGEAPSAPPRPRSTAAPQRTPSSASASPSKAARSDSRRFSAAGPKRRSLFGGSSSSASAAAVHESAPPPPLPSPSAHITPSSSTLLPTSQSMGRTQSAVCPPSASGSSANPKRLTSSGAGSRLNGASSHGAIHSLFRSNEPKPHAESDKPKEKEKDLGKSHFREFVNLLSRGSTQQATQHAASASESTAQKTSSTFKTSNPFTSITRGAPSRSPQPNPTFPPAGTANFGAAKSGPNPPPYIYGYVFFQQRPDSSIRRGYFQKSFVVLSHLPLLGLWTHVVEIVGQALLRSLRKPSGSSVATVQAQVAANGQAGPQWSAALDVLRAFVGDICAWYVPTASGTFDINVLGRALSFELFPSLSTLTPELCKAGAELPKLAVKSSTKTTLGERAKLAAAAAHKASLPRVSLAETFQGDLLHDLWLLWECVLIGEPILVLGPEPCAASSAVWHLRSLLDPLLLGSDWRPFMNLNDRDFARILPPASHATNEVSSDDSASSANPTTARRSEALNVVSLVGVSNPWFAQYPACADWTTVRVEGCTDAKIERPSAEVVRAFSPSGVAPMSSSSADTSQNARGAGMGVGKGNKVGHSGGAAPAHYVAGVSSRRKRRVSKDRPLLKQVSELNKEGRYAEASEMLRSHFTALTKKFLAPLESFFAKVVAEETIASQQDNQQPAASRHFDTAAFLAYLKAVGSPLPLKSRGMTLSSLSGASIGSGGLHMHMHAHTQGYNSKDSSSHPGHGLSLSQSTRIGLYTDFIRGPNFSSWWESKWRELEWEQATHELELAVRRVETTGGINAAELLDAVQNGELVLGRAAAAFSFRGPGVAPSKWADAPDGEPAPQTQQPLNATSFPVPLSPDTQARIGAHEAHNDLGMGMMRSESKMGSGNAAAAVGIQAPGLETTAAVQSNGRARIASDNADGSNSGAGLEWDSVLALSLSCSDRSRAIVHRYFEALQQAKAWMQKFSVQLAAAPCS
ncbi:hypothetical protein V8E36_004199 [Tilletia maclaganii]